MDQQNYIYDLMDGIDGMDDIDNFNVKILDEFIDDDPIHCIENNTMNWNKNIQKMLFNMEKKNIVKKEISEPSKLRISTMTATCSININLDLKKIYDNLKLNSEITYIELQGKYRGVIFNKKSQKRKEKKKKKKKKTSKRRNDFYNQATVHVYHPDKKNPVNVKLFKNGNIQMTGTKSYKMGIDVVTRLIEEFYKMEKDIIEEKETMEMTNYNIQMINSDFDIRFKIDRLKLFTLLRQDYNMFVEYEPCNYPGVNIKYFWKETNTIFNGICSCDLDNKRCKGKKNSKDSCKIITIAVFQSGKIIITGAKRMTQVDSAYKWIIDVLHDNYDIVVQGYTNIPTTDELKTYFNQIKNNKVITMPKTKIDLLNSITKKNYKMKVIVD